MKRKKELKKEKKYLGDGERGKDQEREMERDGERGGGERVVEKEFSKNMFTQIDQGFYSMLTSQKTSSCNTHRHIARVKHHILQAYMIYTYMHKD